MRVEKMQRDKGLDHRKVPDVDPVGEITVLGDMSKIGEDKRQIDDDDRE